MMDQTYGTTEKIFDFIRKYYLNNLDFPSYREIAINLGFNNPSYVHKHMFELKTQGKIEIINGKRYRLNRNLMLGMFRDILESEAQ